MSGVPVIVVGNTHYRNKGFTLDPDTWEAYFELLSKVLSDTTKFHLSQQQVELAWNYALPSTAFSSNTLIPFPGTCCISGKTLKVGLSPACWMIHP